MTGPGQKGEDFQEPGVERKDSTPRESGSGSKARRTREILRKGQLLQGNYEVLEQIGEGGMAIVYKARQKSLNRLVAVKALHPKLSGDKEFISRFEAESGALAALSHPNIVAIIERGHEKQVYFFIMEFVDGEDLDQKIIQNTLTPNDWRHVVASCADALEYVHKRGVVHRDIKPSNILVDGEGRVKIGDFGIAHIIAGDEGLDEQGRKRTVGTQHYMAPEQSLDSGTVDHRADIYSLGVAFYKMMTRKLPVGDYPAPSEVNNDIPMAVDGVLFKSMAPAVEDRYQSVREFCDDLQKALRDQSVSITSILNYRGKAGGSALYSGQDFSRKAGGPSTPSSATVDTRRVKSDTGVKKLDAKGTPKSTVKSGASTSTAAKRDSGSRGRRMDGGNVRASSDLVALPIDGRGAKPTKAPKSNKMLIIAVAVLLLAGVGIIAGVMMTSGQEVEPAPPPVVVDEGEAQAMSESRMREELLRQRREERQRQLMGEGTPEGAGSPDAAPGPVEPEAAVQPAPVDQPSADAVPAEQPAAATPELDPQPPAEPATVAPEAPAEAPPAAPESVE